MDEGQLVELSRYFDEYMFGDRKKPETQQAALFFKSVARGIYSNESEVLKKKMNLEQYIALVIHPEVLSFLDKRQAKHPVITPEKITPKS